MIPTARVQRGPSEAARCASKGIVPATPLHFSILLEMIGEANQNMLCSVYSFKSSRAERLIEPERGPCMLVFGKDCDIGGNECAQAHEHIPPTSNTGITLYCGGITEMGNHRTDTDSYVRLERTSRIPSKKVDPNSGHSQMNAGILIQALDVRRGLQDFALNPKPTVITKISKLSAVTDRILEVEVRRSRCDSREVASSRYAGETIREVSPNISRHIPFSPCRKRN